MDKKDKVTSRRDFLRIRKTNKSHQPSIDSDKNEEIIKMLTPDGRLVEVKRSVVEGLKGQKASNKDILDWSNKKYH